MRKIYFLAVAFVFVSRANSQPTIQSTGINPIVGEAFTIYNCDWVSEGNSGANETWDLSAMQVNSSYDLTIAAATGSTPNANIDNNYGGQSHMYQFNNSSEQLVYNQLAGTTMITFSDPMKMMEFPLTDAMGFTDDFSATFTSSGYSFTRAGTMEGISDGWGTLITPEGTFTDVIRVRLTQTFTDTYSLGTIDYDIVSYIWYKSGYHAPIANVVSMTTSVSAPNLYSEYMEVDNLGLSESNNDNVQVYPNPAKDELNLKLTGSNTIEQIQITDMNGNILMDIPVSEIQSIGKISISELTNGIYFVRVVGNKGQIDMLKFVKA